MVIKYTPEALSRTAAAVRAGHAATVNPDMLAFALELAASVVSCVVGDGLAVLEPNWGTEPDNAGYMTTVPWWEKGLDTFCVDSGGIYAGDRGLQADDHPSIAVGTRCDSGPAWGILYDVGDNDYDVPQVLVDRFDPCELCGKHIEPGSATYAGIAHYDCYTSAQG